MRPNQRTNCPGSPCLRGQRAERGGNCFEADRSSCKALHPSTSTVLAAELPRCKCRNVTGASTTLGWTSLQTYGGKITIQQSSNQHIEVTTVRRNHSSLRAVKSGSYTLFRSEFARTRCETRCKRIPVSHSTLCSCIELVQSLLVRVLHQPPHEDDAIDFWQSHKE